MNVSIVGCTGLVGRKMLEVLSEQNVKAEKVFLFASENSSGSTVSVFGKSYPVSALNEKTVKQAENSIALFAVNKNLSQKFAPLFIENGCVVIDNSSAFRMERDVPLVVPNVNGEILTGNEKLIANPNCSTIQAVSALKILNDYRSIKRVSYVTFQAVSGAGQEGVRDLEKGKNNISPKKFPRPIFSNCIPQVDEFDFKGYTYEENKMIDETKKILGLDKLSVTATCVRVPVFNCHSECVNVEFFTEYDVDTAVSLLKSAKGVKVFDGNDYATVYDADGSDQVMIGRIRRDYSAPNALTFWCVADNLRVGAATNAVEILKLVLWLKQKN